MVTFSEDTRFDWPPISSPGIDRRTLCDLIRDWVGGSPVAAEELHGRLLHGVSRVIDRHLNHRFRARIGVEDIAQGVFLDMFVRLRRDDLRFETDSRFRGWLHGLARNKTIKQVKFHSSAKRSVHRDRSMGPAEMLVPSGDAKTHAECSDPEDAASSDHNLPPSVTRLDEESRSILRWMSEGRTQLEIARALSTTDRTVRRKLQRIRKAVRVVG